MFKNYNYYFKRINNVFEKKFRSELKSFNTKIISGYMPDIYNKWLYSVIEKDFSITPAAIFLSLSQDSNIFPAIKKFSDKKITIEPLYYSVENHPVVNDLKIIIQNFAPIYDLDLNFDLKNEHVKNILSMLSIYEINYLEYLKIICLKLNLFQTMPSIYCQRLCLGEKAHEFLKSKPEEIFDIIFDATSQIFYENICSLLDVKENYDESDFAVDFFDFYNQPINKLIKEIMFFFNIDKKSFLVTDGYNSFNDCVYFLNIAVNRFFFLLFGHYLKLIMPIYTKPFNFKLTFTFLKKHIEENFDLYRIFDFANTKFILTNLGKNYLGIETAELFQRLSEKEVDYIINNLECIDEKKYPVKDTLIIYKIKIDINASPQYWKTFDCSGKTSLHELFLMICREFFLPADSEYNFIRDENKQDYNLASNNKISLNKLHLSDNDIFYLILHNQINYYAINNSKLIENHVKLKIHIYKSEISTKNIFFDYKLCRCAKKFNDTNLSS